MGSSDHSTRHDRPGESPAQAPAAVDLYWLPLGAGGHVVRFNGRVYERLVSFVERRGPSDLYHAALVVQAPQGRFAIESAPVPDGRGAERGVVAGGPVGSRLLGGMRIFRYEVRCWRDGIIPDLAEAVDSPQRLTEEAEAGRRLLETLRLVPHRSGAATNCTPGRCGTPTP